MKFKGKNFQSWTDFSLEVDGLTAVVGPSNRGKSSIHRALRAVLRNNLPECWIKYGQKHTTLTLDDGLEVVMERSTKSSASYTVGGQEFKKLNRGLPPEIKALGYEPIEIGTTKFDPDR